MRRKIHENPGNVALQLFNDHLPSWILLSIRRQRLLLDLLSLLLLIIMRLFAKTRIVS